MSPTIVQAAEECRMKPGSTAPSGSRWLYRINRTDHRHCWFLSSKAVGAHSQVSRRYRLLAGDPDAASQDQQRDSDLQATSAPTNKTDDVAAKPPVAPQATMPAIEQSSENLVSHSVLTIVYRPPPPTAQTALEPTVGAARAQSRTPAGGGKSNVVLLAGAAVLGLLFAAVAFHVTRHIHLRSRTRAMADQQGARGPVAVRLSVATKPSPMMADLPRRPKDKPARTWASSETHLRGVQFSFAPRFVSCGYGRCERRNIAATCGSLANAAQSQSACETTNNSSAC